MESADINLPVKMRHIEWHVKDDPGHCAIAQAGREYLKATPEVWDEDTLRFGDRYFRALNHEEVRNFLNDIHCGRPVSPFTVLLKECTSIDLPCF